MVGVLAACSSQKATAILQEHTLSHVTTLCSQVAIKTDLRKDGQDKNIYNVQPPENNNEVKPQSGRVMCMQQHIGYKYLTINCFHSPFHIYRSDTITVSLRLSAIKIYEQVSLKLI